MNTPHPSPTIGVAVPTYRRQSELERLLGSLPTDVAVCVSDNGCTLTSDFMAARPTVRFSHPTSVLPMFANWNSAARMVDADWVVVPSDDDIYFDGAFDQARKLMLRHPQAEILIFGHHTVDQDYKVVSTWRPAAESVSTPPRGFEWCKFGVDARMPSVFFRRTLLQTLGYFDDGFVLTAADSDLIQRALLRATVAFSTDVISGYRVWPSGGTSLTQATQGWLNEIDRWAGKLDKELQGHSKYSGYAAAIRDELFARNLLGGVAQLRRAKGRRAAFRHVCESRYPRRALLTTQFRILYQLIRA